MLQVEPNASIGVSRTFAAHSGTFTTH